MKVPVSLSSLLDDGIIDAVERPLMGGKEALVYLVRCGGETRVAKVYKEASHRSFKHRASYTEGRQVRGSRDQRAIDKRSRYGRAADEAAWRSAEVDVIYRLHAAGVRVPVPYNFVDGVLVMELIKDERGEPAPRLGDVSLSREQATAAYGALMRSVVQMLCAGIVHGDLSDFNVLMGPEGPVVIDFPQAVDAARNQNARNILARDVANLDRFLARFVPGRPRHRYAEEMWDLYSRGELAPDSQLTGRFQSTQRAADVGGLLRELAHVERDESRRRERRGEAPLAVGQGTAREPQRAEGAQQAPLSAPEMRRRRVEVVLTPERPQRPQERARGPQDRQRGPQDRQRGPQDRTQDRQRGPQDRQQRPPERLREPQDRQGGPQDRPQRAQQAPQHPHASQHQLAMAQAEGAEGAPKKRRRRRRRPSVASA